MKVSSESSVVAVAYGILLLQFVTVPFLGDIELAGKLFVFVFAVLLCGLVFFRRIVQLEISPVLGCFAVLVVLFFVSARQAINPAWSFIQVGILSVYLLFLLMMTHLSVKMPVFREKIIDALLFLGIIAASLGLYEYVHFLVLGPTGSMLIPYLLPPDLFLQIGGPLGQPNLFAVFLTLVLLAFLYWHLHRPAQSLPSLLEFFRFVPFFLVGLVFFLTGSRGGFLSFSLIFGFLAWLVASGRYLVAGFGQRGEFIRLTLCLGAAFLVAKGLNGWFASDAYTGAKSLGDAGISTDGRFVFWTSAILIFLDHPWLGIGLDGYKFLQTDYGPLAHKVLGFVQFEAMGSTNWAHNELLQILCEGGMAAFFLSALLILLLLNKIWKKSIKNDDHIEPFFLYSHLFLLPFIIQSMFEWPFRHPSLLALFFACLAVLLSQYPLWHISISPGGQRTVRLLISLALGLTVVLFYQEIALGSLKRNLKNSENTESTLPEFESFANNPYSAHRALAHAVPRYAIDALSRDDNAFAVRILPYYERLCMLKGAHWNWHNLALIYYKVGRETDARESIQKAIDLMPSEELYWQYLHYLNTLQASRNSGRPLESFFPTADREVDLPALEFFHE